MRTLVVCLLALLATSVRAGDTCANKTSCEGKLKTQILAAFPVWTATITPSCSSLMYVGYPHCVQLAMPAKIPTIIYGETNIAKGEGGVWWNHAKAPKHRPSLTPDSVLVAQQLLATNTLAIGVHEYGDERGGVTPGCYVEAQVCMSSPGGGDLVRVGYSRSIYGDLDYNVPSWYEIEDTSVCEPAAPEPPIWASIGPPSEVIERRAP